MGCTCFCLGSILGGVTFSPLTFCVVLSRIALNLLELRCMQSLGHCAAQAMQTEEPRLPAGRERRTVSYREPRLATPPAPYRSLPGPPGPEYRKSRKRISRGRKISGDSL